MSSIEDQIEDMLREKGDPPPYLNSAEFMEEVERRLITRVPIVVQDAVEEISQQIALEELEKIGRVERCRYYGDKKRTHCNTPRNCFTCPSYASPGRLDLLLKNNVVLIVELWLFLLYLSIVVIAIVTDEVRVTTMILMFIGLIISQGMSHFYFRKAKTLTKKLMMRTAGRK